MRSTLAELNGTALKGGPLVRYKVPVSRGGRDVWTNTVTACRRCNTTKGCRSPEQSGMPLLYVPYVPNRHEHFILRNRRILADQMEYLLAGVPKSSRLYLSNPLS